MCGLHDTVCMNGPSTSTQIILAKESSSQHVLPLRPEKINPLLHRLAQPVFSRTKLQWVYKRHYLALQVCILVLVL